MNVFFHPVALSARDTWCVEGKDKQLRKTDHTGSYFIKPDKDSCYTEISHMGSFK